jgi:hypothetical protein
MELTITVGAATIRLEGAARRPPAAAGTNRSRDEAISRTPNPPRKGEGGDQGEACKNATPWTVQTTVIDPRRC